MIFICNVFVVNLYYWIIKIIFFCFVGFVRFMRWSLKRKLIVINIDIKVYFDFDCCEMNDDIVFEDGIVWKDVVGVFDSFFLFVFICFIFILIFVFIFYVMLNI